MSREHIADRAVIGDRIGCRLDRPKAVDAVGVGVQARSAGKTLGLLEVLYIIVALLVGVPHVDDGIREWSASGGRHPAVNIERITFQRPPDIGA